MDLPFKVDSRERKFLVIGAILASLIIIYRLTAWYGDINTEIRGLTDAKMMMLEKQLNNLSEMERLQEGLESFRKGALKHEKALLKGDKPPVAAAELQSILKEMISSLEIEMRSERALSPVEAGYYLGVPVEIGFVTDTAKLKSLLYKLRRSALLLNVTELKTRVTNLNNPLDTYITLTTTGFIKNPSYEGTAKKGQ